MEWKRYNEEHQKQYPLAVGFRQEPYTKSIRSECDPTINDWGLMSEDMDFMTKTKIRKECICSKASICMQICDLLSNNKNKEADNLLSEI